MVAHPVPMWGKGSHETKSKAFRLEKIKKSPLPFSELSGLDSSIFFDSRVLILDKRPLFGWGEKGEMEIKLKWELAKWHKIR